MAQTASTGDIIFVYNGDGTTTGQAVGIMLKANQQLIGEGVALVVDTVILKVAVRAADHEYGRDQRCCHVERRQHRQGL